MTRFFRNARRLSVILAVTLAAQVFLGTTDWWHPEDDDAIPATSFHDHTAHRAVFGSDGRSSPGEHCYICHWLRSLRNGLGAAKLHKFVVTELRTPQALPIVILAELAAAQVPARAPPA